MLRKNARGTLIALVLVCTGCAAAAGKSSVGIRWSEHLVWNDFSYGFGLQAVDVNGDEWLDLTVADTAGFVQLEPYADEPVVVEPPSQGNNLPAISWGPGIRNSHVYWFKNDGRGGFEKQFIVRDDLARRLERHIGEDLTRER